jgi:hypothetical protein
MKSTLANPKSAAGADIHCESAVHRLLEDAARLAIAISAFFLLSEPYPDPALGVIVEEPDPGFLEGRLDTHQG